MNPTMAGLIELQRVDDEIFQVKKHRDDIRSNLERLRTLLSMMEGSLADKRAKLAEVTRFHSDKRLDLEQAQERITSSKQKMMGITRSREYAAMTKELEHLRKRQTEDEQELERLATAISEYSASIADEETKLGEIRDEVAREEAASADRVKEFDAIIARVGDRRADIEGKLPRDVAARYNRILERRDGSAVVLAVKGRCTGCNMSAPPQIWVKIQIGREIFQCSSCQRFLYYDVEEAAAVAAAH